MSNDTKNAHFTRFLGIFYILKIVVFMNNMGVLKTRNGSAVFNIWLSWFIYTPTEKSKNYQENQYFLVLYIKSNQYRPQYRQTPQKSTLSPISQPKSKPTIQTTFFLYKYKITRKSTLSPITNFSLNLPTNLHQIFHILHLKLLSYTTTNPTFLTCNP